MELKSWEEDPALYLFTSLTAGSSHIVTATSRIETILKAARIPFSYVDTATNEGAKKLFQRRARGKKLPLLVKEGFVIADLEQVEDWNEFGELKDAIGEVATTATSVTTTPAQGMKTSAGTPLTPYTPPKPAAVQSTSGTTAKGDAISQENKAPSGMSSTMAQLAQEAAAAVKEKKGAPAPLKSTSSTTATTTAPAKGSAKENPLSPTSVPLPATPAVASPPPSSPRAALSPTSPRHSIPASPKFIPEKSEPPQMTHRGSSLSLASDDEIRKVESDEMIVEDEEGEEEAEKDCVNVAGSKKAVEDKDTLGKVEKNLDDEEEIDKVLFGDADEEEEEIPKPAPLKTKTTETAKSTETKEPVATKSETEDLADKVSKVKIQDQAPAEGKLATESVEE